MTGWAQEPGGDLLMRLIAEAFDRANGAAAADPSETETHHDPE